MQLIDGARQWWRLHSNKLAVMAGGVAAWAVTYPQDAMKLAELLPEGARQIAAFVIVGVLPIAVRMMKQASSNQGSKSDGQ